MLLVACGGGGGTGDGGGSGDDGEALSGDERASVCDGFCAHAVECGWAADAAACESECASDAGLFRGTFWRDWVQCSDAAPCAEPGGETCFVEALDSSEPRAIHEEYVERCQAARADCGIDGTLPDCDVSEVLPFTDAYVESTVLPCFDQSCDAMIACIETTVRDAF